MFFHLVSTVLTFLAMAFSAIFNVHNPWKKFIPPSSLLAILIFFLPGNTSGQSSPKQEANKPTVQEWRIKGALAALQDSIPGVKAWGLRNLVGLHKADTIGNQIGIALKSLKSERADVREAAAGALRGQASLPSEVVRQLVALLQSKDNDVRWAAVEALRGQASLPSEVVKQLVALLQSKDGDV